MTDDDGPRFRLPPITLPELFPEGLRFELPPVRRPRGSGSALLAAAALDLLDAAALLWLGGGLARVALGTLLALVLVGAPGLAYAWEALALLLPRVGLVPSALLLVFLDRRR